MKRGTEDHPKTIELQRRLRETRRGAVGILQMLWMWAAKYAPAGDVGRWDDATIAAAVHWEREPCELIDAMVGARLLDRDPVPGCRLYIHNWHKHAEDAIHSAMYRAVQTFALGHLPSNKRLQTKEREKLEPAWAKYMKGLGVRTESAQEAHAVRIKSAQPSPAVPSPAMPEPEPGHAVPPADAGPNGAAYLEALTAPLREILGRKLNASEQDLVERWRRDGVPVRTVLGGVRDAYEPEPGKRREPRTLHYFDAAVLEAHVRRSIALSSASATDQDRPPPATGSAIATWELVRAQIRSRVQTQTWELWFAASRGHAVGRNTLQVLVPVAHVGQWIQQHYADVVAEAAQACGLTCQVEYLAESEAAG